MVCGTPVVAFNRSASQESLHPLASRTVESSSQSIAEVSKAIVDAMEEPTKHFNWTTEGMSTASVESYATFSPYAQVDRMHDALRSIRRQNEIYHAQSATIFEENY